METFLCEIHSCLQNGNPLRKAKLNKGILPSSNFSTVGILLLHWKDHADLNTNNNLMYHLEQILEQISNVEIRKTILLKTNLQNHAYLQL